MDFEQKKKMPKNQEKYHIENLKVARDFSKGLLKEMNDIVRAIVLFGSNTNNTLKKDSDIDLMIVLNNVSVYVTPELREAYKIITNKLNHEICKGKIHLMTINLSDLWDMSRKGDPVMVNVLRYGLTIFDRDLIEPLQYLLEIGKVRPTREAVNNYVARSKTLFEETDKHLENSLLDLYYSVIDIVHATIMSQGITPASPKEMPEIFSKTFKNKPISKYSKEIKEFYELCKDIEKGKKKNISGKDLDFYKKKAEKIILDLDKFCKKELERKDIFEL
jgi:predicted nucleotidyltransferase